jgi:hypothetical protein
VQVGRGHLLEICGSAVAHTGVVGGGRSSRATILKSAAAAGAAAAAGGGLLALRPGPAFSAPSASQDVRILNFVLLLEYVQAAFYGEARKHAALGSDIVEFAKVVGGHEDQHVAALEQALGPKARKRPTLHFGAATRNRQTFLAAAIKLEDLGVAAYNGQAANLTPKTLLTAAEIVSVEARHAGWIRAIAGKLPAVGATDKPVTGSQAMTALAKTGFVAGLHP